MSEAAFTDSTTRTASPAASLRPDRGQLDEHDVAERCLRVVGDADRHGAVGLARASIRGCRCSGGPRGRSCCLAPGCQRIESTSTLPLRTNGGFTTRAASALSRTATCHRVAAATPCGSARERDRLAERGRERAAGDLALAVRRCAPSGARAARRPRRAAARPTSCRAGRCASSAALPTKSRGLARSTVQARPGVERRHASRPCPGRRGSCRPRGAACRARRARRAARRRRRAPPTRARASPAGSMTSKPSSPV